MRRATACLLAGLVVPAAGLAAERVESTAGGDWRDLVAAAVSLREATAEAVWPGWATGFEVLVLDGEREVLLGRSSLPDGFEGAGRDPRLGPLASRPAVMPTGLLATLPLFGAPPTIVVGVPELTGKTPSEWLLVLLHEHFHQWQMREAAYFEETTALDLHGGDTTGRWMLEYAFPYEDPAVGQAFADLSRRLAKLLRRAPGDDLRLEAAALWRDHQALRAQLPAGAARYLDFQLWQEGVARFVELRVAEEGAARWKPPAVLLDDPAYEELGAAACAAWEELFAELEAPDLATRRRVSFYAYGAGLALLLDRTDPAWKGRYEAPRLRLAPPSARN